MSRQNQIYFEEDNSWFGCIGDIDSKMELDDEGATQVPTTKNLEQSSYSKVEILLNHETYRPEDGQFSNQMFRIQKNRKRTQSSQPRRNSSKSDFGQSSQEPNSEEILIGKHQKECKSKVYSKKYRQKMKDHVKHLQEENESLKKRIRQIEFRLRQAEMELNRMKFMPEQKQFTIEQLNEQFMDKVTVVLKKSIEEPIQSKIKFQPTDPFFMDFVKIYQEHGFAGSKKTELLNYYFNEILEAMMRDSERYLSLLLIKSPDESEVKGLQQFGPINRKFLEILNPNEDILKRLNYFQVNLHPMVIQFMDSCKQLYKRFQITMSSIQKIHEFMKFSYLSNMDFSRKRIIELEPWFQKHKYSKMMRNLRSQWLYQIKTGRISTQTSEKVSYGTKKKKVVQKGL